ncbi:phosphodiester glycosidase family protein [Paenibacillus sp. TC-CSREp1]|uniref:phosphodiester glycosidase family protein n=1 Tax=Paenibacillus sp. TC-CSREp1 TaxID=3410089 RepID=UPI003D01CE2F
MTVAQHIQYSHNGKVVHAIKADLGAIVLRNIGNTAVVNQPKFGVNGTFFNLQNGQLTGIAMQGGLAVHTNGSVNQGPCGIATKRGTMYCYNGGNAVTTGVVTNYSDTSLSNIKWAIGGYSLFPNVTYTQSAFYTAINGIGNASTCDAAKANSQNAYRFDPSINRPRTAIGWDGSKIWLAVFQSENAYQVRQFMINRGCNVAIMLDGGDSSQMKYAVVRNGNPSPMSYDPSNEQRGVFTMVAVEATDWV